MRVTNQMVNNTVVFNMQRSLQRFMKLQTEMSSGRRINKPSDDPLGTLRDLSYRGELAKIDQYRANINGALNWTNNYDGLLADVTQKLSRAKELATTMADEFPDADAREGTAEEIRGIFNGLLTSANAELEGKYIFSGYKTSQEALVATANGVVYNGNAGLTEIAIGTASKETVNLLGNEVFLTSTHTLGEDSDVNVGLDTATLTTLVADFNNGQGIDQTVGQFTITDQNLGTVATVDVTAAANIGDVLTSINNALAATVPPMNGSIQAVIGRENNNIMFETTRNGLISDLTSLGRLHLGNGVDLSPGKVLVTDGVGINVEVDLSTASTIGDIRTQFNNQMAAAGYPQITMGINGAGTGLQINDAGGPRVPPVVVKDLDDTERTAFDLGIIGEMDGVASIVGADLDPLVSFNVEEVGAGTTAADLGIKAEFTNDYVGDDLDPLLKATDRVIHFKSGFGLEMERVVVQQGDESRVVDLSDPSIGTVQDILDAFNTSGLDITASINPSGRGIQIVNDDPNRSLMITDEGSAVTTKNLGIFGSSDMLGSLLVFEEALKENDQEGIGLLIENLENSINHILKFRSTIGTRAIRLETTDYRLIDMNIAFTELLSEVEDADISQAVTDLASYENSYRSALMATAKILQPSLLDFLA
ncbi:flagellar hook-associated protein 3 [candidate division GN15 bacterium]|nr:flagellar hook-associated protein 3 [candidate division GN15 bacterium]